MLAKVWKKLLLAICIIACIYNVMNKLVSRTSLEIQLKSVQNQPSLIEVWTSKTSEVEEVNANEVKAQSKKNNETIVVIY